MKTILFSIILSLSFSLVSAQNSVNTYDCEKNTYITNPQLLSDGSLIFTDNYASKIYRYTNGELTVIQASAGCGRYLHYNAIENKLGFKYINEEGMQAIAILDVSNKQTTTSEPTTELTGQPSFSNNNKTAYTIENTLYVETTNSIETINLGAYVNLVEISPNGNYVAYALHDQIIILNLISLEKTSISPIGKAAFYPQWSPNSQQILYQSEHTYVYDLLNSSTICIPLALSPSWSLDAKKVIYCKTTTKEEKIESSDIFLYDIEEQKEYQLTNTPNRFEMQPTYSSSTQIIYHGYQDRSIYQSNIIHNQLSNTSIIYHSAEALAIAYYQTPLNKAIVQIPGTVPYVHQVYDTPDWHYGYGSCSPTTCIMAIAYYNLLPKWQDSVSSPTAHISDYGKYVADKYTLNEIYYDDVETTSGGENAWGGYGYLWNGSYSPNSRQKIYLENHYFTSNQLWTSSCLYTNTTTEIDNDYPHPICSYLTTSGHLTLATGYVQSQHTLIFHDPYGNKNTPNYPSYDGQNSYYDWPGYNNGYQNLDASGTHGGVAWTTQARNTQKTYNDTIIDDIDYHHGFEMNNSQNTSHMRYFHDLNSGYNNHLWYTFTMSVTPDICWVEWFPTLSASGLYEVKAFIPADSAKSSNTLYHVYYSGIDSLVIIDQSLYNNQWVSLGTFDIDTSMIAKVYLGDSTGVGGESIAFDAVLWSYLPLSTASFTTTTTSVCQNELLNFTNNSQNATSYAWSFEQGTPATSTSPSPQVSWSLAGDYDVELIAYGVNGNDTLTLIDYVHINANPIADFSAIDTVLYLPNANALFTNNSQYATSYLWDFGDGNTSSDINPWHIYSTAGFYAVKLKAISSLCGIDSIILNNYIEVCNSASIENKQEKISVWPIPATDNISISYPQEISDKFIIKMYNIVGELIFMETHTANNQRQLNIQLETYSLSEGKYYILIETEENRYIAPLIILHQ